MVCWRARSGFGQPSTETTRLNMIVAITEEEGVVHYLHTRRLIDGKSFANFLKG